MSLSRTPIWAFVVCSAGLGLIGLFMVVSAFSTASLHFGHCGPNSLSSHEQFCRGAAQLLVAGYGVLFLAALPLGAAIWLRVARRAWL